jgi:geranylgeranyl pyrophosphate synthase
LKGICENKMGAISFTDIYYPIKNELLKMENELKIIVDTFSDEQGDNEFKHSFKRKGKRLRPALLILSAKTVNNDIINTSDDKLINLAVALELIHNASLIHDDIIDEDKLRRGQKTLNNLYGNRIAVLVGDALNARAFHIISSLNEDKIQIAAVELIEKMSLAEILQIKNNTLPNKEVYLEIIKAKTAIFMEVCCGFGASIAGGSIENIKNLQEFGLNLGMTYQIVDDVIDNDPIALGFVGLKDAIIYANKCKESLVSLKDSIYKQKLLDFIDLILKYPNLSELHTEKIQVL